MAAIDDKPSDPLPSILALEQGTTSFRTIDVDASGAVVTSSQREFSQFCPKAGCMEHDAEEIRLSQQAATRDALGWAFISAPEAAPSFSGRERAIECAKNRDEANE